LHGGTTTTTTTPLCTMGVRTVVRLAAPAAPAHWVQALISSVINIIIVAFPAGRPDLLLLLLLLIILCIAPIIVNH
jgi:hypothetical protein